MVSNKRKLRKKLKYNTYKKYRTNKLLYGGNVGGNITSKIESPAIKIMIIIKNMAVYTFWTFLTAPVYFTTALLNTPFNNVSNITNARFKNNIILNDPLYKTITGKSLTGQKFDENIRNSITKNIETGKMVTDQDVKVYGPGAVLSKLHLKGFDEKDYVLRKKPNIPNTGGGVSIPSYKSLASKFPSSKSLAPFTSKITTINPAITPLLQSNDYFNFKGNALNSSKKLPTNFQPYHKYRLTKKSDRNTFMNYIKSKFTPDNIKSLQVIGRDYDVASMDVLRRIYDIPLLDQERKNEIYSQFKKLDSLTLLKALIVFKTIFKQDYNQDYDQSNNNICNIYLKNECNKMGVDNCENIGKSENIPTFYEPLDIIRPIRNVFKYKAGLNPLNIQIETFTQCLKSNLTQDKFTKEDLDLCVDEIDRNCEDCTLKSNFKEVLKKIGYLFSSGMQLETVIDTLFHVLIILYKNQNTYDKNVETVLVNFYLGKDSSINFKNIIDLLNYVKKPNEEYKPFKSISQFIGEDQIKVFKDLMCKYDIGSSIEQFYLEKRKQEIENLKKNKNKNTQESNLFNELMNFLNIFFDKSVLEKGSKNSNDHHMSIDEIKKIIKDFIGSQILNTSVPIVNPIITQNSNSNSNLNSNSNPNTRKK